MSSLKRKMKRNKAISQKELRAARAVKSLTKTNAKMPNMRKADKTFMIENAMKNLRAKDVANILSVNEDLKAGKTFNVMNALTPAVKAVVEAHALEVGININDKQAMNVFTQITIGSLVNDYNIDKLYGDFVKEIENAFSSITLIEELIVSRKDRYERLFKELAEKEDIKEEDKQKLLAMSKAFTQSYQYKEALTHNVETSHPDTEPDMISIYDKVDEEIAKYSITLEKTENIAKVLANKFNVPLDTVNRFVFNMLNYFDECAKDDTIDIIPTVRKFYFFDILIIITRLEFDQAEHDFTKSLISDLEYVFKEI